MTFSFDLKLFANFKPTRLFFKLKCLLTSVIELKLGGGGGGGGGGGIRKKLLFIEYLRFVIILHYKCGSEYLCRDKLANIHHSHVILFIRCVHNLLDKLIDSVKKISLCAVHTIQS